MISAGDQVFPGTDSCTLLKTALHILYLVSLERIDFMSNIPISNQQLCTAFRKGMILHETRTSYGFTSKIKSLKLKAIRYIGISLTWILDPFIFKQKTHLNCIYIYIYI